jgi:hypothetical protein
VNVNVAEYVPVLYCVLFAKVNTSCIDCGLLPGHPVPVQEEAAKVTTGVVDVVLSVCVPEQAVPTEAALQT